MAGSFTQSCYKVRNDDGSQTAATWKSSLNAICVLPLSTKFRIRFGIYAPSGSMIYPYMYHSYNGGAYSATMLTNNYVTASSSTYFTNNASTTQQITSGNFNAGLMVGNVNANYISMSSAYYTEVEYCISFNSANISAGNSIALKVYNNSSPLSTYTTFPTFKIYKNYVVCT